MSRLILTPELLRELIHYDPDTGDMSWRNRHPALYADLVPNLPPTVAIERAAKFNAKWGNRIVGTDQAYKSEARRVRISLGNGLTPLRRNAAIVAWMIGSGRAPREGHEIVTFNGVARDLSAANLVECTPHVRCILENPQSGVIPRQDGRWTWVIRNVKERLRGNGEGYETRQEARAARDAKLAEMGLLDYLRLSDLLNGQN